MAALVTCKNEKDPIQYEDARVVASFSLIYPYGGYLLSWKPEFESDLVQTLMQPFPQSNDAPDET